MSTEKYKISSAAIKDLEEIWAYTLKTWSVDQADRYYQLIINEIEYISTDSESGKSMAHIRKGYRASKIKSHLIFYREIQGDTIEVIRILHQRMDIESRIT